MTGSGKFPTTRWTLIQAAGTADNDASRTALASLCEIYWYPLYGYARRRGHAVEAAQDLTQEFFSRVIEKRYFERADRDRGKLRTFLLSAFVCFLCDEADRRHSIKRGGTCPAIHFDFSGGEKSYLMEPSHDETPDRVFERRWALALLNRVLLRLQEEYAQHGKADEFDQLKTFLPGKVAPLPYAEVASRLRISEGALKVSVHRLRKRYREVVREEVGDHRRASGPGG